MITHLYKSGKKVLRRMPFLPQPSPFIRAWDRHQETQKCATDGWAGGQAEVVWTCHEERPKVYRKKDDGNGVTGKEEKRETKEKIFRCGKRRYGGSWCERDGH